jgi:hypothetical protein
MRLSDWDVYRFGLRVGARTFPAAPRDALKRLVLPVEYIRCAEFRYVLQHLEVAQDHRVLDIGSPKLLSLFLAARVGADVWATDLVDYFFTAYGAYAASVRNSCRGRYRMETQDAQALTYGDEAFDRIFSVSVVEHIPGDGDVAAMQEIAACSSPAASSASRCPGATRATPRSSRPRANADAYWVQAGSEERVFYQRAYDRDSMEEAAARPPRSRRRRRELLGRAADRGRGRDPQSPAAAAGPVRHAARALRAQPDVSSGLSGKRSPRGRRSRA